MISRRAFIGAVAGGLAVAPATASAQPAKKVARIGYVTGGSTEPSGIDRALAAIKRERSAGLIVLGDRMFGPIGSALSSWPW